ncbi:ABC transporter substrate-binding protein [Lacrimispora sp. NSJ-141]|uniref:ABC transporter substrate-binding protein n=1 Tax=Lientehia hominis TaxID=2897778 RepID=A0AAP2RHX7_9FIRM|nr:ABC transporter substrate-binding protein [Lientehia hominis]MCD2492256.1 ABC transporter substrate-binding protein [Lientehia hominis]
MKKKLYQVTALVLAAVLLLGGCGQKAEKETEKQAFQDTQETSAETKTTAGTVSGQAETEGTTAARESGDAPEIAGLTYESAMELIYAEGFDVYFYEGGYGLIDVHDSARYLVVPEGKPVPDGLDEGIIVLPQPLDQIYLAATSAMALFASMNALDAIRLSGTQASGWYINDAVKAMESGDILFAGKYSEPDYELLVNEQCDLAIESTMILHSPKVQEMIEMLDIPVFIDRSSYESHPLGRTEWIKAYSVMVDKEDEAKTFFDQQAKVISDLKDFKNTEKTVAYFYVSTDGSVVVRKPTDYIPKMIEIGGGRYAFSDLRDESGKTSIPLTMEEFYAAAVNADYLVYNASIDAPLAGMEDLLAKSEMFEDFKAVKEGNVWTTGKSLYQATDIVGELIRDLHLMLTGGDASQMTFLTKVE